MAEAIRILILEDNPADSELVQFEMEDAGIIFTSKVVMTEQGYVQALQKFCPDLILSDYDLPKYNGLLALAEARKRCPDTPFILVTGAVTEDRAIDILTQGAKDYVLKNRLQQRLVPAIQRALAEAEEHRARKQAEAELREAHRTLEKQVDERTAELRESKERLSLALTSSRMGTFQWDLIQNKRYFDDYVYFLLGIKPENFSGKAEEFFQAIHPDDRHAVQAAQKKAIEEGAPYETEYRVIWPDSSIHHIVARGKVLRDDTDRPFRMLGVCWEITEHKQMEKALRESEERFRSLSNASFEGIMIHEQGVILDANLSFARLFGYEKPEELIGMNGPDFLLTPESSARIRQRMERQEIGPIEVTGVRKDGTVFEAETESQPVKYLGHDARIVSCRNITDRKRAEERMQRYELLATHARDIVLFIRLSDGRLTEANEAAVNAYGYTREELLALTINDLRAPDTRILTASQMDEAAQKGILFQARHRRKDGTLFPVEVSSRGANIGGVHMLISVIRDITERKQAEYQKEAATEAMRESEERYRALIDSAPDAIVVHSQGNVLYANPAAIELYEAESLEHLESINITTLVPTEDSEMVGDRMRMLTENKTSPLQEAAILRFNGEKVPVDMISIPIQYGGIKAAQTIMRDITERKRAEEEHIRHNKIVEAINRIFRETITCETEEQLGTVCLQVVEELTGSAIGFIGEIRPDGFLYDIAISNPGWEACAMITPAGHRRPPGRFRIHGLYGRVLTDGKSLIVNAPATHPDAIGIPEGHPPLTAFLGTPLLQDGKTIGLISVGNRVDGYTLEQQRTLETLAPVILQSLQKKHTESQLQIRETQYRSFFENAAVGTAELSPEGRFLRVNNRLCQMTGYSAEELLQMTPLDLSLPEDVQHNRDQLSAYLKGDVPVVDVVRRYRRKNGSIIWAHVTAAMIRDANGKPLNSSCVIIDITERRRAEEALKQQSVELAAANKELESFSYSVSHDLQAPLRAITGYSQMILKKQGAQFDEETRRRFQMITDNAEKMGLLIEDLLAFSRLGSQDVAKISLNMEELAGEVWQELVTIHPCREMTLRIGQMPAACGDKALIRQVYGNLLGNAVKFTQGRQPALIETGSCVQNGETVYYVRDNGVGFDMRFYDKLFGVFQRLHSDEEYKGTGIGLALVQKIINRHGGRIWAEGRVDEGATFYFTFPINS